MELPPPPPPAPAPAPRQWLMCLCSSHIMHNPVTRPAVHTQPPDQASQSFITTFTDNNINVANIHVNFHGNSTQTGQVTEL